MWESSVSLSSDQPYDLLGDRRRREWGRHLTRCGRTRPESPALREGGSRQRHLICLHKADPRRFALSGTLRFRFGAARPYRTGSPAAGSAPYHLAAALRAAPQPGTAARLAHQAWALPLRPPGRPQDAAGARRRSIFGATKRAGPSSRISPRPSSIPIAGSRIPAWWS